MKDIKSSKIGIIGAGALGGSLAIALNSLGYQVPVIFSRSINSANYLSSKLNIEFSEPTSLNSKLLSIDFDPTIIW